MARGFLIMKLKTLKPIVQAMTGRLVTLPPPSRATDYRIRGRALQTIREQHFREHPLCVHCLEHGRVTAGTQVDHRVPLSKGGTDTANNRQSLCDECHKLKTINDLNG